LKKDNSWKSYPDLDSYFFSIFTVKKKKTEKYTYILKLIKHIIKNISFLYYNMYVHIYIYIYIYIYNVHTHTHIYIYI